MRHCRSALLLLAIACGSACGGNNANPNNPGANNSGAGSSGGASGGSTTAPCVALVGNKGTITASISGLAPFNGIVANGGSNLVTGGPVPTFVVGATNVSDATSVIITGPAVVGTSAVGPSTGNSPAASNSISVQTRSCASGMGTGNWIASIAFGSGTIVVTSASATGVAGTFSATHDPGPGFSGTRTITGSFSATF
jgi:hypothetical protein